MRKITEVDKVERISEVAERLKTNEETLIILESNGSNYIAYASVAITAPQNDEMIHRTIHFKGPDAFDMLDYVRIGVIESIKTDKRILKELIDEY